MPVSADVAGDASGKKEVAKKEVAARRSYKSVGKDKSVARYVYCILDIYVALGGSVRPQEA